MEILLREELRDLPLRSKKGVVVCYHYTYQV